MVGRPLTTLVTVSLATTSAAIALVIAASWISLGRLERDQLARYRTSLTLTQLNGVLADLLNAETSQRGYLLTGDSALVADYPVATGRVRATLATLRDEADPTWGPALGRLAALATRKVALLDSTIALQAAGRTGAARAFVASGAGERLMDQIRAEVAAVQAALQASRERGAVRVAAATLGTRWGVAASGILTLVLIAGTGLLLARALASQRRSEAALAESEARLTQIIDAVPVGVFVIDAQGRPVYTNRASAELIGKPPPPGVTGEQLPEVYQAYRTGTDELYPAHEQPIMQALRGDRGHTADIEIRRADRTVQLEVWSAPVRDATGAVALAIAAFSDITEERRLRAAMDQLNTLLQRRVAEVDAINAELEAFSYSVSHDLRAPLRGMHGFATALLEDHGAALGPEGRDYATRIVEAARRMDVLIQDLLAYSRLGREQLALAAVDLDRIVGEVLRGMEGELRGRGAAVEVIGVLGRAVAQERILHQVLANLISNAVKFVAPGTPPRVRLRAEALGDRRRLWVEDNGIGVPPEHRDRVFRVFERLHSQDRYPGTGIGLAIVRRGAERMGGAAGLESDTGRGSRFWIDLPETPSP
jgi:PAS domain S-box-containing protein